MRTKQEIICKYMESNKIKDQKQVRESKSEWDRWELWCCLQKLLAHTWQTKIYKKKPNIYNQRTYRWTIKIIANSPWWRFCYFSAQRWYWYDIGQEDTATWCYCKKKTVPAQWGNLECCPLVVLSEARGLDFILSVQFVPLAHDIVFKTSAFD